MLLAGELIDRNLIFFLFHRYPRERPLFTDIAARYEAYTQDPAPSWQQHLITLLRALGPVGLARFCTLRSWLSQWGFETSRAHGERNAAKVDCPVLVIGNGADNACTPSHTQRLFDAVAHGDKTRHDVPGATHYYAGQPELCRGMGRRSHEVAPKYSREKQSRRMLAVDARDDSAARPRPTTPSSSSCSTRAGRRST